MIDGTTYPETRYQLRGLPVPTTTNRHKVVSHFNKHYKGQLARILALSPADAYAVDDVAAIASAAGLTVEGPQPGKLELTLVV
ncbi:hypothetical protein [Corynebacterium striatum]|uniref:hypothetical protein n=1 Tax=Corynebacterium striatum TaxID=43770 RepID=UPI00195186AD|nr:hypothetical protein [Corynebacterium striatum]QRP20271.1 hypothetical protein I6J27_07980 [Corynebacterium striatum]